MSQAVRLIKAGRSCGTLLYHISDDELGEIQRPHLCCHGMDRAIVGVFEVMCERIEHDRPIDADWRARFRVVK